MSDVEINEEDKCFLSRLMMVSLIAGARKEDDGWKVFVEDPANEATIEVVKEASCGMVYELRDRKELSFFQKKPIHVGNSRNPDCYQNKWGETGVIDTDFKFDETWCGCPSCKKLESPEV